MSLKKKLGMGIVTAVLGVSLVGGGTFAYFNDEETVKNSFAAGTLDLSVHGLDKNGFAFNVDNLKPGDWMERNFTLKNVGSLNIDQVLMNVDIKEIKKGSKHGGGKGDNTDLAKHLKVDFFKSDGNLIPELSGKYLSDLVKVKDVDITPYVRGGWWTPDEPGGIPAGRDTDKITVKITFVDNKKDQNHLQGESVRVDFELEATQEAGERR